MKKEVEESNAYSEEYRETLRRINERKECPFCWDNLEKEHPNPILFKTKNWLVTENAFSYKKATIRLLIIYRGHINAVADLPAKHWVELLKLYQKTITELDIRGCALLMRQGEPKMTGATVRHLHAHILGGNGEGESEPVMARVG